jgi:Na+/H+ antiporter NhaA
MKTNSYMTIGIAAGLFTATLVGISIASYVRSKKRISKRTTTSGNVKINPPLSATDYAEDIKV